jgi:protein phosphatase
VDPSGPFDIIGDVHGCFDELQALLGELGYAVSPPRSGETAYGVVAPPGRTLVFLGDLVDRGPRIPDVLRLVMDMVAGGTALCLLGNHDDKLLRKLKGRNVQVRHGLEATLEQLAHEPPAFRECVRAFLSRLETHCVLDGGKLVVAHAGLRESLHGRRTERARDFALYGDVSGKTDAAGLPVRRDWARHYRGRALVVYGHTPVVRPVWVHNTLNIDTGCVFGGRLTALCYPERELVSVPARRVYAQPSRPLLEPVPPVALATVSR